MEIIPEFVVRTKLDIYVFSIIMSDINMNVQIIISLYMCWHSMNNLLCFARNAGKQELYRQVFKVI